MNTKELREFLEKNRVHLKPEHVEELEKEVKEKGVKENELHSM